MPYGLQGRKGQRKPEGSKPSRRMVGEPVSKDEFLAPRFDLNVCVCSSIRKKVDVMLDRVDLDLKLNESAAKVFVFLLDFHGCSGKDQLALQISFPLNRILD
jgi:hypothetical protein